MCRPINASKKQRNCHVKIMIIDDQVAIQGNGNQGGFSEKKEVDAMLTWGLCICRRAILVPFPRIEHHDRFACCVQGMD